MAWVTSTVLAVAAIASAAAATGTAIYSSEEQASAASKNAAYQAQVAKNNQSIADQNASIASQRGEAQTNQQQLKTRATVGAIKAQQAANNVDTDTGSAVDVRSSAASLGELDALTIRSNAAREVYGYQTQGQNFSAQAGLLESESDQALMAGNLSAAGSFLGGASSVAGTGARFGLAGAFNTTPPPAGAVVGAQMPGGDVG